MRLVFIESDQTNPYWNVAVENYLMQSDATDRVVMYLWKNRRTVVVGMNQNPFAECNVDELTADGGYVMRRTTGGGAVYHDDGNINFSFVAPYGLYDQERQFEVIRRAVESYGLEVELSGRNDMLVIERDHSGANEVISKRKFSGNAFSKGRSQRLHHGTILIKGNMDDLSRYLKVKPAKLHKHGVKSVQSRVVNLSELNGEIDSQNIVPCLRKAFVDVYGGGEVEEMSFNALMELPQVRGLYEKYSSDEWLYGQWRHFKADRSGQFEWGAVDLCFAVDEARGVITSVTVNTDALDVTLAESIRACLNGASITQPPALRRDDPHYAMLSDILTMIYD